MLDLKEISQNYQEAINHIDDKIARQTILDIQAFLKEKNLSQSNPPLMEKLKKALVYLRIVAFSTLPEEDSCDILKNHVLDFFDIDVPLEKQLSAKLFYVPEAPRDELRKRLNSALLANSQKIGNFSIGQWIQEFEKTFNAQTRDDSATLSFSATNHFAQMLDPKEKLILKKILHAYDFFLVATLPATGESLQNILDEFSLASPSTESAKNFIPQQDNYLFESHPLKETPPKTRSANVSQMNIGEILLSYPEAGEQLITPVKIKIKGFPDFVRPSVKNWLADYTLSMENDRGGLLTRNDYLFKNPNTSYLDQQSRQHLDTILKSFDEKIPLAIDTNNKIILFPKSISQESLSPEKKVAKPVVSPVNNISNPQFFSAQKMSFEKKQPLPSQTQQRTENASPQKPIFIPKTPSQIEISKTNPQKSTFSGETPEAQLFRIVPLGKKPQSNFSSEKSFHLGGSNVINLKDLN